MGFQFLLALSFHVKDRYAKASALFLLLGLTSWWPPALYPGLWVADAYLLYQCWHAPRLSLANLTRFFVWSALCKAALVHHLVCPQAESMGWNAWLWTLINLLGTLSLALFLARRFWLYVMASLSLLLAFTAWVDLIFTRYFQDFPGIYLLTQLNQGGAALPGTLSLMRWEDSLLGLDLLAGGLAQAWLRKPWESWQREHTRAFLASFFLFFGVSIFPQVELVSLAEWNRNLRGRNIWIVNSTGFVTYHLLDLQQFIRNDAHRTSTSWNEKLWEEILNKSRQSIDEATPFRGKYAGCNLVFVQLESLQFFALQARVQGHPVMPSTREFLKTCLWGGLHDQGGVGRSSDGEFVAINSQVPCPGWPVVYKYPLNKYRGIAYALREMGYRNTYVVDFQGSFANCRITSINYGFQNQILTPDLGDHSPVFFRGGLGLSDEVLFQRIFPKMVAEPQPFYFHVVTISSHYPFKEVPPEQRRLKLAEPVRQTMLGDYLECCARRDQELASILDMFRASELWKNTVFCFYGDHDAGVPDSELSAFLGQPASEFTRILNDRVAFMIHVPDEALRGEVDHPLAVMADLSPTLCHLLGVKSSLTQMSGLNLLSKNRHEFIIYQGGEGYALTESQIILPKQNRIEIFDRKYPHRRLPQNPNLVARIVAEYRLVLDSFRLNVQVQPR